MSRLRSSRTHVSCTFQWLSTTSEAEKDVLTSYSLHANCFITKPVDMEQFTEVIKSIKDFWFTIVKLPVSEEK